MSNYQESNWSDYLIQKKAVNNLACFLAGSKRLKRPEKKLFSEISTATNKALYPILREDFSFRGHDRFHGVYMGRLLFSWSGACCRCGAHRAVY